MEFEVKESKALEDGRYDGEIVRVEYRTDPYEYTDVFIKEKESGMEIKFGCPSNVSAKSKLGKLLCQFVQLTVGEKVDPEKILVGKKVSFLTIQEKKGDNIYTRVVEGSVKPR